MARNLEETDSQYMWLVLTLRKGAEGSSDSLDVRGPGNIPLKSARNMVEVGQSGSRGLSTLKISGDQGLGEEKPKTDRRAKAMDIVGCKRLPLLPYLGGGLQFLLSLSCFLSFSSCGKVVFDV